MRWAERAEHQLLRSLGWAELTGFPRRRVEVDFLAPLRFGDEVVVEIAASAVGRTSITYGWRVLRDGVSCIEGSTTCVHVGDDGAPCGVPAELRAALDGGPLTEDVPADETAVRPAPSEGGTAHVGSEAVGAAAAQRCGCPASECRHRDR